MPIPESTSAEGLEQYVGGKCLVAGRGKAWREVKASLFAMPSTQGIENLPSINEPALMWMTSGEVEIRERETGGPWVTTRVKKGSFFLTVAGAPYDCSWKTLTPVPFEFMLVLLGLPLLQRALEEVFGAGAPARLRDVSGFNDDALDPLMESLRRELLRRKASPLFVQGVAQAIAVHLARNYAETTADNRRASPSLPGYKLRRITDWMAAHLDEEVNLDQLAARAGLSKFHFHRLFKSALGVSPSHYHLTLRMDAARRLLRETKKSVVTVALDVGYANPSHFAQLFRRETGLSPSDYRRQR